MTCRLNSIIKIINFYYHHHHHHHHHHHRMMCPQQQPLSHLAPRTHHIKPSTGNSREFKCCVSVLQHVHFSLNGSLPYSAHYVIITLLCCSLKFQRPNINKKERVSEIRTNSSVRRTVVTAEDIDTSQSIWLSMSEVMAVQTNIFTSKRGVKRRSRPDIRPHLSVAR